MAPADDLVTAAELVITVAESVITVAGESVITVVGCFIMVVDVYEVDCMVADYTVALAAKVVTVTFKDQLIAKTSTVVSHTVAKF